MVIFKNNYLTAEWIINNKNYGNGKYQAQSSSIYDNTDPTQSTPYEAFNQKLGNSDANLNGWV
jgi:hypothetical protein